MPTTRRDVLRLAGAGLGLSVLSPRLALAAGDGFREADDAVVARLRAAGRRVDRPRVIVWCEPEIARTTQDELADRVNDGVLKVERKVGLVFDRSHYADERIEVFAASEVSPSHAYGGYEHPRLNHPYVFFPAAQVRANTEPYLHELTHIILHPFGSHTLREGYANYVHLSEKRFSRGRNLIYEGVADRAGADHVAARALRGPVGQRLLNTMGADGIPDLDLATGVHRPLYYVASYSFVAFLLSHVRPDRFIALHVRDDVMAAAERITGRSMPGWRSAWLAHLGVRPEEVV